MDISTSKVIYGVELYFDKTLQAKLMEARIRLTSAMNYYKSDDSSDNYLTMTLPEIHKLPCMTLFTTSNPSVRYDYNLGAQVTTTIGEFFDDKTSPRGILPVTFDLETVFDMGDEHHMFLSPLDRLGDVREFRERLCMEMESRGVSVKGNYFDKGWVPVVQVMKQTWKQYDQHKVHDEKCWKEFCKENNYVLTGFVDKMAVLELSPRRHVWEVFAMRDDDQKPEFFKDLM